MKSLLSFVQHQQALMPNKLKRLKRRLCSLMMSLYSRLSTVLTVMMTSLTRRYVPMEQAGGGKRTSLELSCIYGYREKA